MTILRILPISNVLLRIYSCRTAYTVVLHQNTSYSCLATRTETERRRKPEERILYLGPNKIHTHFTFYLFSQKWNQVSRKTMRVLNYVPNFNLCLGLSVYILFWMTHLSHFLEHYLLTSRLRAVSNAYLRFKMISKYFNLSYTLHYSKSL